MPANETNGFIEVYTDTKEDGELLDGFGEIAVKAKDGTSVRVKPSEIDLAHFHIYEMDMPAIAALRELFVELGGKLPVTFKKVKTLIHSRR